MSAQFPAYPGDPSGQHPYGAAPTGPPQPTYASWGRRVGGSLIDTAVVLVPGGILMVVGFIVAFSGASTDPVTDEVTGVNGVGFAIVAVAGLLFLVVDLWNRVFRQGRSGQTIGKQALGMRLVGHDTAAPIGAGMAFGRWLIAAFAGAVPFGSLIDVLWPLWDDKNQTVHDKIVSSVVVHT